MPFVGTQPGECLASPAATITEINDLPAYPFQSGIDIRISSHEVDRRNHKTSLWIEWRTERGGQRRASKYDEREIQVVEPQLVYAYWRQKGGRCEVTDFQKYHVLEILAQQKAKYLVQWVGYDKTECTWEPIKKVGNICPGAVMEWNKKEEENRDSR
ncbi:uncharacterized protein FTOL_08585 [Fusarium torulosum]|uniref:Chromo domain-containing protein n=1 Tax=Fusarium torulosum TaxID=33205 RepID=A0AAE8MDY9_9HYPO|nr:uncharacterized protein FTOL_08585 [Fusarium torulosum]